MTALYVFIVIGLIGGAFLIWYSIRYSSDPKSKQLEYLQLQTSVEKSLSEIAQKKSEFNKLLVEAEDVMDMLKMRIETAESLDKKLSEVDEMLKKCLSALSTKQQEMQGYFDQLFEQLNTLDHAINQSSKTVSEKIKTLLRSQGAGAHRSEKLENEIEVISQKSDTMQKMPAAWAMRRDPRLGVLGVS